jgi:hypothetical protein
VSIDLSGRWIEWKVLSVYKNQLLISLIDGFSESQLGRAWVIEKRTTNGKDLHLSLFLMHGLLNKTYTISLDVKEELRPDHFEPLVSDVEGVLPNLSGDVVIALFQAIRAGRMFDSLEGVREGRARGVGR